eukprot:8884048-Pyramimonas_sp.AAC.1
MDIRRSCALRASIDEQPRNLAEDKKATARKVECSSNIQAQAVEKMSGDARHITTVELMVVSKACARHAVEICGGTGDASTGELTSLLHDCATEVTDQSLVGFMAPAQNVSTEVPIFLSVARLTSSRTEVFGLF